MVEIEDTYAEAFDGLYSKILITARDDRRLKRAAESAVALPSTVFGKSEGGIESNLDEVETPDGRKGITIQIWVNLSKNARAALEDELGWRIRQGILVVPTTSVFNALDSNTKIDIMEKVGRCGDGYEQITKRFGRELIEIPIMMGDFIVERYLGYARGIMGGNIWLMCETQDAALEAGDKAINAINRVNGVITPFNICSAGSKPETNYPEIGPTTNHPYCPTIKGRIKDSKVPEEVNSIPEIVINGVSINAVKKAMKAAIDNVQNVKGLLKISAGNFGGKLGRHHIYLRELT
jgi:formylmethanofuran--tetrahydromethanopterin N-formyltransferase